MFDFFQSCFDSFRHCFSTRSSFHHFVSSVLAFIASPQPYSLSALVRALSLKSCCYDQLQKFFKKSKFDLDSLSFSLIHLIQKAAPLWTVNGQIVLIGDGCKVPADAYKFPALSREWIESQSSSKPNGLVKALNFEELAFLGCHHGKCFPLPVWTRIATGNQEILEWQGIQRNSQPKQMGLDALKILHQIEKPALLVLDRYDLSKTLLETRREYNQSHNHGLHLLVRVKKNLKVWTNHFPDPDQKKGRGRPKKRDFYSLSDAFEDSKDQFRKTIVSWNGKRMKIEFLCLDQFLWGDQENPFRLRFVLIKSSKGKMILASSDFSLSVRQMIETYALRFQIEICFKNQKELFGAYQGRFSCQALEKFNLKAKKGAPGAASRVREKDRRKVIETYEAHERYAQIALIAQCLCELYRIKEPKDGTRRKIYQRTYGEGYSLREIKHHLGDEIKAKLWSRTENWINRLLGGKITTFYYPKKIILRSRDRTRVIQR